jgi:hypothetical protein
MKKFLSDVLIDCGLTVNGTASFGTATATTVATSDNSTNIATTAWVKSLGYSTTDSYISGVSLIGNSLSFTGINSAFTGTIDLSSIVTVPVVETVYETVKNVSGNVIYKGTPLAVVAGQTEGFISDVVPADASDPAKMPALFIANEDMQDEAEGEAVVFGAFSGVDTSLYQSGTVVYVAPGGGWTDTKPVWPNKIQNLGVITKSHHSNGGGIVTGVGRANDIPNLTAGKIWVGTANYPVESTTVHIDEANARMGIGTTSPTYQLHVSSSSNALGVYERTGGASLYLEGQTTKGVIGTVGSHPLVFATDSFERARIDTSGNVGIGTASPDYKLDVRGSVRLGGTEAENHPIKMGWDANSVYFGGANTNTINVAYDVSGPYNLHINYNGYLGADTQYRNLVINNGRRALIAHFDGASRYVGIGTASPGLKLDVDGAIRAREGTVYYGTGSYEYISYSGTNGYYRANGVHYFEGNGFFKGVWDSSGNVGIGTTSPVTGLDVRTSTYSNTTARFGDVRPVYIINDEPIIGFNQYYDNGWKAGSSGYSAYLGMKPTNGDMYFRLSTQSNAANAAVSNNDVLYIKNNGNVGIGTTSPSYKLDVAGYIRANDRFYATNGTNTVEIGSSYIQSYLNSGAAAAPLIFYIGTAEKVRIASDGNVGIGTTSPTKKLHVVSGYNEGIFMEGSSNGGHWFDFKSANSNLWSMGAQPGLMGWYNRTDSSYKMVITDGGNVGIGTTSPGSKLHVEGTVVATGGIVSLATSYPSSANIWGISNDYPATNYGITYVQGSPDEIRIQGNSITNHRFGMDVGNAYLAINSGNVGIGTTSPSAESNLSLAAKGVSEGGHLTLFKGTGNSHATHIDNYSDSFRIMYGTDSSSAAVQFMLTHGNGNVAIGGFTPAEKLHISGNIRIDGSSTAIILQTGDKTASGSGAVFATYDTTATYGAVVDYVVYDSDRNNMRTGTFTAVWNTNETNYNDVSTVDIGDTSTVTLTSQINGADVELIVTGDAQYTIKFNVKLIK